MSDKMTIVGKDGVERYLVDDENRVTDLRICHCETKDLTQQNGEQHVCLVCGLPLTQTP